jgi:hypothetical protein
VTIDHNSNPLPIGRSLAFALSCSFTLPIEDPLPLELSGRFLLQDKPRPPRRCSPLTPRRRSPPGAGKWRITKLVAVEHSVDPPPATRCAAAVYCRHNLGPHAKPKQPDPLVRSIQDSRIVPGQPAQIFAVDIEFLRGFDDIAKVSG